MLPLGLPAAQYREFMTRLATSHEMKTTTQLLTPEHQVVSTVSHTLLDGQVDVTAPKMNRGDVEVSRTSSLTFVDPYRTLALDSRAATDGAFYMDRMIRNIYSVRCSFGWVDVPVFTGPIVKVDRDGDLIDVECQGKERYALGSAWVSGTENGRKGDVMAALMRRTGEISRYMDFPDTKQTVSKPVSIGRESTIWSHVWRVNSSMSRVLHYDGRGIAQSRRRSAHAAVELRMGDGGLIVEQPQISYSIENLINAVRVQGVASSKGKATPFYKAVPPKSHPLSPQSLGRRGKGNYLAEFVVNTDLKSVKACRALAREMLDDFLMQQVETTVQTFPIPHLEPWDLTPVSTPEFSARIRVNAFSLPLVQPSGQGRPMQIGSTINLRKPRRPRGRP